MHQIQVRIPAICVKIVSICQQNTVIQTSLTDKLKSEGLRATLALPIPRRSAILEIFGQSCVIKSGLQ